VVERILGKAEVVSSILTGSTIFPSETWALELTGGRASTWSLAVTKNWSFRLDEGRIMDLDLEDYH
jgi:hypothetical protein